MVDRYFQRAISDVGANPKVISTIRKVTDESLLVILKKIRDNLLENDKKQSSEGNSLYNDVPLSNSEAKHYKDIFDTKIFVAKMTRERFEREKKRIEREEKGRIKLQQALEEDEKKRLMLLAQKETEKKKRVEDLVKKKEKRKKQLDEIREIGEKEFREVVSIKPLYVKIEENYEEQVLMPELEKKKAELARKREFLQPIKRTEIIEHMKKYQEAAVENQIRREFQAKTKALEFKYNSSAGVIKSRFTDRVLEEEKKKKEDLEKVEQDKARLIEKKKKYAEVVKEMFVPSVDEFKKQEMLLIQERLKNPVRIKLTEKSISDEENKPRRKWKKNPMVPEEPLKKEVKVVDYLAEKRKKPRGASVDVRVKDDGWKEFSDNTQDEETRIKNIKKRAEDLEKQASKFERYIKSVALIERHH